MQKPDWPIKSRDHIRIRMVDAEGASGESIIEQVTADCLMIQWPTEAGKRLPIIAGQTLAVLFSHGGKAFEFLAEVVDATESPGWHITMRASTTPEEIQRRDHFRMSAHGRAELTARVVALAEYKDGEFDCRKIEAEVCDISAGGCSIILPTSVPVDSHYDVKLFLQGGWDEPVIAQARVVWRRQRDDRAFEHGLVFCNVTESTRRRIMRFVFDAQREQMREDE